MSSLFVLGGARSGKSSYAEMRAAGHREVTYIATGVGHENDADWQERIAAHRDRRPAAWHLIESTDLRAALSLARGLVLIDCLSLWLTNQLDELNAWLRPRTEWGSQLEDRIAGLTKAIPQHEVIVVSNEVGFGVHPDTHSGRIFRDELGRLNIQVANICDEVVLIVAGIPQKLKGK